VRRWRLLLGGVIAAPIAAWLVRHIPARILGSAVGGLIVLLNSRTLLSEHAIDASSEVRGSVYVVVMIAWVAAVVHVVRIHRRQREQELIGVGSS
jgi:uncharacterized membrane protein YfcA